MAGPGARRSRSPNAQSTQPPTPKNQEAPRPKPPSGPLQSQLPPRTSARGLNLPRASHSVEGQDSVGREPLGLLLLDDTLVELVKHAGAVLLHLLEVRLVLLRLDVLAQ